MKYYILPEHTKKDLERKDPLSPKARENEARSNMREHLHSVKYRYRKGRTPHVA